MYHVQYFGDGYETGWVYSSSTLKFERISALKQHTNNKVKCTRLFDALFKIPSHLKTALKIAIQEGEMSLQLCTSARLLKYGLTYEPMQDFRDNIKNEIDRESLCVKDKQSTCIKKRKTSDDNLHSRTKYKRSKISNVQTLERLKEQIIQKIGGKKQGKL